MSLLTYILRDLADHIFKLHIGPAGNPASCTTPPPVSGHCPCRCIELGVGSRTAKLCLRREGNFLASNGLRMGAAK